MESKQTGQCTCPDQRSLVVCIDGTSNQFGKKNTNVVELYSKIVKSPTQLTYYNSGIGTYAKPSWKSFKYVLQVVDNTIDLAIAWNFERIIMSAYRWLSDNYQENDRIYLFGFSRGAYQVRVLAGMIYRVGLIHKGNEEQIPFAYELYASPRTDDSIDLAERFKETFSRDNVRVHFVGVWDTVSSVGIIRGKTLPSTDSAEHVCVFRHALALDERRVKFLPEYVHGGAFSAGSGDTDGQTPVQGFHRIKEVWFPGTHSDIGGGNRINADLDLGGTPLLWMSFEAVCNGLRLTSSKVDWPWGELADVKESLTGGWRIFEWMPIKRLSYKSATSTTTRFHRGRGRKVLPGQKIHSCIAFCPREYQPKASLKAVLPQPRYWTELVGQGQRSNERWADGWKDILEMDIFDYSLIPDMVDKLKSGHGGEESIWIFRLTVMTSTDDGLKKLLQMPDVVNDLVRIFLRTELHARIGIIDILERLCNQREIGIFSGDDCRWLLRVAREHDQSNVRGFAVRLIAHNLSSGWSPEDVINREEFIILNEMVRDQQRAWVSENTLAVLEKLLHERELTSEFLANILSAIGEMLAAPCSSREGVIRLLTSILASGPNRQRLFDNDVVCSLTSKICDEEDSSYVLVLGIRHGYLPMEVLNGKIIPAMCIAFRTGGHHARVRALIVLEAAIQCDATREQMKNSQVLADVFGEGLKDPDRMVIARAIKCCESALGCGNIINADHVRTLGTLLDGDKEIIFNATNFFEIAIKHGGDHDMVFTFRSISALRNKLHDWREEVRKRVLQFFIKASSDGLHNKIFNADTVSALREVLTDEKDDVRSVAANFFTAAASSDDLRIIVFNADTFSALRKMLYGPRHIRWMVFTIFRSAASHHNLCDNVFNADTISEFQDMLTDERDDVRSAAVDFFTAAASNDGLRVIVFDKDTCSTLRKMLHFPRVDVRGAVFMIFRASNDNLRDIWKDDLCDYFFNVDTISAIREMLHDREDYVRSAGVDFFTVAASNAGLRNAFNKETVSTLLEMLSDSTDDVKSAAVHFFTVAARNYDIHDKIFRADNTLTALRETLCHPNSRIKPAAAGFFAAAASNNGLRNDVFDPDTVSVLREMLHDREDNIRSAATYFFTAAASNGSLCDNVFNADTVSSLREMLHNPEDNVRLTALRILLAVASNHCLHVFDVDTISSLREMMSDKKHYVRLAAVDFFTAAASNGGTCHSCDMRKDGIHDNVFNADTFAVLREMMGDKKRNVRSAAVDFFAAAASNDHIRANVFNAKTFSVVRAMLEHQKQYIRSAAVDFFTAVARKYVMHDNVFDAATFAAVRGTLRHPESRVRSAVADFFAAAASNDGLRANVFDPTTVSTLREMLQDPEDDVRLTALKILIDAASNRRFRNIVFNADIFPTLRNMLDDQKHLVRWLAVEIFTSDGVRDIIDAGTVSALRERMHDPFDIVRSRVIVFFSVAASNDLLRGKIFKKETFFAFWEMLRDPKEYVRSAVVYVFTAVASNGPANPAICVPFNVDTVSTLLTVPKLATVDIWSFAIDMLNSYDNAFKLIYDSLLVSTLCEKLATTDSDATNSAFRILLSLAINHKDIHDRICSLQLRKLFECTHCKHIIEVSL